MEQETSAQGTITRQVLKSMLGGLLGSSVGVLAWFLFDANTPGYIPFLFGALGIAAGVGLTLPGVSAKRVAKGVVAGIVTKPLPGPLRRPVVEAILGEEQGLLPEGVSEERVCEILERAGTPAARRLLETLAEGAAGARMAQEAKAALERLAKRPSPSP